VKEIQILRDFMKKHILAQKATVITNVPVGLAHLRTDPRRAMLPKSELRMILGTHSKKVDAVCLPNRLILNARAHDWIEYAKDFAEEEVWLLEVKNKLNTDALGKILVYNELFAKDNPKVRILGLGIVCKKTDVLIEKVCKKYGVEVFVV